MHMGIGQKQLIIEIGYSFVQVILKRSIVCTFLLLVNTIVRKQERKARFEGITLVDWCSATFGSQHSICLTLDVVILQALKAHHVTIVVTPAVIRSDVRKNFIW